jgi:hypothetical protein
MEFKEWLRRNGDLFWEVVDVHAADTSEIKLDSENEYLSFDEELAWEDCQNELDHFDDSEYFDGVYDSPEEDPEFDQQSPDDWKEENPKPVDNEFPTPEEFETALKKWRREYKSIRTDYNDAVEAWEQSNEEAREEAEREAETAKESALDQCVQRKRDDYYDSLGQDEDEANAQKKYSREFSVDDESGQKQHFTVDMEPTTINVLDEKVGNCFNITFMGPKGYSLTGMSGSRSSQVYSQLLLSVKKLTEVEDVRGFHFVPADPAMQLIYERFYQQFMKPKYVRINKGEFIRADVLKDLRSGMSDEERKSLASKMVATHQDNKQSLQYAAMFKNEKRGLLRRRNSIVGMMIIPWEQSKAALILDILPNMSVELLTPLAQQRNGLPIETAQVFRTIALPFGKIPDFPSQKELNDYVGRLDYRDKELFPILNQPQIGNIVPPNLSQMDQSMHEFMDWARHFMCDENTDASTADQHQTVLDVLNKKYPVAMRRFAATMQSNGTPLICDRAPITPAQTAIEKPQEAR